MKEAVLRVVGKEDGSDKKRALEAALSQIDRAFGKGSVMRLGQREPVTEADTVSTGSLGLDIALGIGGLPRGRVIKILQPQMPPVRRHWRCMSSPRRRRRAARRLI